jgi:hypothetical protein
MKYVRLLLRSAALVVCLIGMLVSCNPIEQVPTIAVLLDAASLQNGSTAQFGDVLWGNTKVLTFTIKNNGEANLNLTAAEKVKIGGLNPEAFTVTPPPDAVVSAHGGSTTFSITFSPASVGLRAAMVSIPTDAADAQPLSFMLAGTGVKGWRTVGAAGFSTDEADSISLALDPVDGTPYVAYLCDQYPYVQKLTAGEWEAVGDIGSDLTSTAYSPAILVSGGMPYLAFSYPSDGYPVEVAYSDGYSWYPDGNFDYASEPAQYLCLNESSDGYLYVAFRDAAGGGTASIYSNGDGWFPYARNLGLNDVSYVSLASGPGGSGNNIPYIAFKDNYSGKANVYYDGAGMMPFEDTDFSDGTADYTSLAIGGDGVVYVAYSDGAQNGKVTVMSNIHEKPWHAVGTKGFSAGAASSVRLAIDSTGTLYVAFKDESNGGKLVAEKFNGTSWDVIAGSPSGTVESVSLACYRTTPYVAFSDGSQSGKVTVMRLQ